MKHLETGDFQTAWGGIASLPVAAPVVWTGMRQRGLTIGHLARWMSSKPAALAGIDDRKGAIAEGYDADFVLFDPDAQFEVTSSNLHTRHPISPYVGETLRGKVIATWVRGLEVFRDGSFTGIREGQEVY
jgi:allantoinase